MTKRRKAEKQKKDKREIKPIVEQGKESKFEEKKWKRQ
jgi:hypothetical protein